jgi:hypothetical protein
MEDAVAIYIILAESITTTLITALATQLVTQLITPLIDSIYLYLTNLSFYRFVTCPEIVITGVTRYEKCNNGREQDAQIDGSKMLK